MKLSPPWDGLRSGGERQRAGAEQGVPRRRGSKECAPAGGGRARGGGARAGRSGAGRPTAAGGEVRALATCQSSAGNEDTDLKWACSGDVALQDKRLAGDRRALGGTNSEAQRDRGQPLESNPNSRPHRVVPQARSSAYSQG